MLVPNASLRKSLEEATSLYQEQILKDEEALSYLMDERKITKGALDSFRIGVVRDPVKGHENFMGRISYPYISSTGVTSIRFRRLRGTGGRFLAIDGDEARLYNATVLLTTQPKVFLCEGEIDTITASIAGLRAVGVPGVSNWRASFSRILRYRDVTVLADNDDDGQGRQFAKLVTKELGFATTVMMPKGHDVNSLVVEYGIQALRERVGM